MLSTKFPLGFFPTPFHLLENLSKLFPQKIYIKRDDQTGLATGGNKTRKLEFLIQKAINLGCDTIITAGAQQSNHCRQTAAAARLAKLECHLLLNDFEPEIYQGNLLLDKLLGAQLHFSGASEKSREEDMQLLKKTLESQGKKVFLIPIGGSNLTGALGYIEAMRELKKQLIEQNMHIDYLFFATSSGGTQAGMMLGQKIFNLDFQLMPIKIDKDDDFKISLKSDIYNILKQAENKYQINTVKSPDEIPMIKGYNLEKYGKLTENEMKAIDFLAKTEGILLDPVYTGRAFFGMLDMIKKNKIPDNSNILFWHTGGTPALFAYADEINNLLKR